MNIRIRRLLAGLFATMAVLGVTIGGVAQAAAPAAHSAAHHRKHHKKHRSRIPQHNGGDRDSDNRGGPSDGDGNV